MKHESLIQLIIAALLSLAGIALLFVGTLLDPQGQIHESLLVAFGEIATFAGSIIGIDYHSKKKVESPKSKEKSHYDHNSTHPSKD